MDLTELRSTNFKLSIIDNDILEYLLNNGPTSRRDLMLNVPLSGSGADHYLTRLQLRGIIKWSNKKWSLAKTNN